MNTLTELIPVLQLAIGPVVLISGVGLLMLSMTNRLGRVIDRARLLKHDYEQAQAHHKQSILDQIKIVHYRAYYIRSAILFAAISILCVAALVFTIFILAVMHIDTSIPIVILFAGSMLALMVSLVYFLRDIYKALAAVEIDLEK